MTRPAQPDSRQYGLTPGAGETRTSRFERLAWLPVVMFSAAILLFYWWDTGVTYESQTLVTTLNILFCSSVSILVVYLAARSYLVTGSRAVLLLGSGALAFAITYLLAGLLLSNLNAAVTVHNTGVLIAGLCFLTSAWWAHMQKPPVRVPVKASLYLYYAYSGILALMVLLILGAIAGAIPGFYMPDEGFTLLRQIVIVFTIIVFFLASAGLCILYRHSRTPFLLWYCLGMALIGLCMGILIIEGRPATPLSWLGRGGQYLGGLYMLAALWSLTKGSGDMRIPLERALQETEEKYRRIIETANEGIWIIDKQANTIFINRKMIDMLGYTFEEMQGRNAFDFVFDDDRPKGDAKWDVTQAGVSQQIEFMYKRKDGSPLWALVSNAPYVVDGKFAGVMGMFTDITERKRAEDALKESEEKYRTIVETAKEGIWMVDGEGKTSFVNNRMAEMLGVSREEVLSKGVSAFTDEEGLAIAYRNLDRRKQGIRESHEYKFIRKDGTTIWTLVSSSQILDKDGKFAGSMSMITDITERKQAEEALRASEHDLSRVQSIAHLGFWVWDLNNNTLQWSDETYRILGLSSKQIVPDYNTFLEFVHPDDIEKVKRAATEALDWTKPYEFEWRVLRRDGSIRYVHSQGEVIVESGKPTRMIGTILDITERKLAEEALRESEETARQHAEELEKLMDLVPAAIWVSHDPQCHVISGNKAANRFYEAKEGDNVSAGPEYAGQDITRRFFRNGRELMPDELTMQEAAAKGVDVINSELEVLLPSGRQMTILGNASPLRDADGNVRGCVGAFVDITERKQAEKDLLEAKMQAELYLDLMGHDINNMHQIAIGYLELAKEAMELDETDRYLIEKPLETMQRSAKLIDNVRKLQKVQAGEIKADTIHLDDVLRRVVRDVPGNVTCNNGRGQHYVMANELLYDVFVNLIGNAIKHSGGNGTSIMVNVDTSMDNNKKYYKVSVEDKGPGIPDEMKEKIFNRLQRGETRARGVGLGLYLVKSLVESYYGRVWVENRVAGDYTRGSRFVVMLPAIEN